MKSKVLLLPEKIRTGRTRQRMAEQAVAISSRLTPCSRLRIIDLADELEISTRSLYRWLDSFSRHLDLRIEAGIVIVGRRPHHICT
jgi:predicted DNA-binding transcriptional regulator YafY